MSPGRAHADRSRVTRGGGNRDASRRRAFAVAALVVLAGVLPPLAAAAGSGDVQYVAQSTWGARHLVKLDKAWLLARPLWIEKPTGEGVRVAIIDTGVDASHPDLDGVVALWKDFVSGKARPYDDHGHGTHVAGILAANGHFQPNPLKFYWLTGARGVAPGVELLVAKAMGADGKGEDVRVAEAILWALDPNGDGDLSDGAHIINLSIGIEKSDNGGGRSLNFVGSETRNAVNLAILRGVVVVASSGNDGAESVAEPGDIEEVIAVGAVDRQGKVTEFSNGGRTLDVMAPGVLVSTYPKALDVGDFAQDGYAGMAGTSMAAPLVTGVIALAMDANPALREKGADKDYTAKVLAIEALLTEHARAISGDAAERQGAGVVDAYAVLTVADAEGGSVSWKSLLALAVLSALLGWGLVAFARGRSRARRAKLLELEKRESGL